MSMSRRGFLKAAAATFLAATVPYALSSNQIQGDNRLLHSQYGDFVIDNIEFLRDELTLSVFVRGIAWRKDDPYHKKYFANQLNNKAVFLSDEFKNELGLALRESYRND